MTKSALQKMICRSKEA